MEGVAIEKHVQGGLNEILLKSRNDKKDLWVLTGIVSCLMSIVEVYVPSWARRSFQKSDTWVLTHKIVSGHTALICVVMVI